MKLTEYDRTELKLTLNLALAHYKLAFGLAHILDENEIKLQKMRIDSLLCQIDAAERYDK